MSPTENPGFFELEISKTPLDLTEAKKQIEKKGNFCFSQSIENSDCLISGDLLSFPECYELLEKTEADNMTCQVLLREHVIKIMIESLLEPLGIHLDGEDFVGRPQHNVDVLLNKVTLALKKRESSPLPACTEDKLDDIFQEVVVRFDTFELCKRFLENLFCLKNFQSWSKKIRIENEEILNFARALKTYFSSSDAANNHLGENVDAIDVRQKDMLMILPSNDTKQIESHLNKSEDIIEMDENKWYFIFDAEFEKISGTLSEYECSMNNIKLSDNSFNLKISSSGSNKSNVEKVIDQITSIYQSYENISTKEFFPKTSEEFEILADVVQKKKLYGNCCYTLAGPEKEIKEAEKTLQNRPTFKRSISDQLEQSQFQAKKIKADGDFPGNEVRVEREFPSGLRMFISKGNLIHQRTDAIVNPANSRLRHGGGAARAIADAAGKELEKECKIYIKNYKELLVGEAMHTTAGDLQPNIKYVIHTVGPRVESADKLNYDRYRSLILKQLFQAFYNCFMYANNTLKISSVAVPAISSGIFGVPMDIVTNAMFEAVEEFEKKFSSNETRRSLKEIHFVNFDEKTVSKIADACSTRYSFSSSVDKEDHDGNRRHIGDVTEIDDDSSNASNSYEKKSMQIHNNQTQQEDSNVERNHVDKTHSSNYRKTITENSSTRNESQKAESNAGSTEETCVICMDNMVNPKKLKCGHQFCLECLDQYNNKCQPKCPSCGMVYGELRGNQPPGKMDVQNSKMSLTGYERYGSIEIYYSFYDGIQNESHPNPGKGYRGTKRTAYLPDNPEGREVSRMLKKAFDNKILFTIGNSHTTGRNDVVVWNDIHHKTSPYGQYGYPDPTYLKRVKEELIAKGIHPTN